MSNSIFLRRKVSLAVASAAAVLLLGGCSVMTPEPLNTDELAKMANDDAVSMFQNQEPVTAAITMDEAVARAIKYNLEHRVSMMERAVAENLADLKSWDLMPKLTVSAGYRDRSNDSASSSESLATGRQSLVPSKSSEREGYTGELEMSWNLLDFGLSYYEAKATGNKARAAEERRRRVVADIARQTRAAWVSAASAEKLRDEAAAVLKEASEALAQSREAGARSLVAPVQALRYQRDLLNMVRQLEVLNAELAKSKTELATLMNLAPGTPFRLALPKGESLVPKMPYKLADLETLSMIRRPELREETLMARNAVLETRMSLLKLFPNLSLDGGVSYDSNKYLVNDHWTDVGAKVGWNLFSLFSLPSILKAGELREELAPLRRQALRMTVLSQVHIAWQQRYFAEQAYKRANEMSGLQRAINTQVENAAKSRSETKLEVIRTHVETVLAQRARDLALAEMVNAQNALFQAAGLDTIPNAVADQSVDGLAEAIGRQYEVIGEGALLSAANGVVPIGMGSEYKFGDDPAMTLDGRNGGESQMSAVRLVRGEPWESLRSLRSAQ